MVEENTAASRDLAAEADALRTLLTQFQLPGGNIAATRHMTELAASPALHLVTRVPRARGAAAPAAESSEEF